MKKFIDFKNKHPNLVIILGIITCPVWGPCVIVYIPIKIFVTAIFGMVHDFLVRTFDLPCELIFGEDD